MPSPNSDRNGQIENYHRRRRLAKRSSSFHGSKVMPAAQIRRPKTVSDLRSLGNYAGTVPEGLPRQPPKLLLKVTVLRSLAPVQVLMTPESTVFDLIVAAVRNYVKEGRRPILPTDEASEFDLHYSQFSLEILDREEKLIELGSRNFFLCSSQPTTNTTGGGASGNRDGGVTTPFASCAKEAEKVSKGYGGGGLVWLKFMHFML